MRKPAADRDDQKWKLMMRKGLWSPEEDEKLMSYMLTSGGQGCWSDVARNSGLQRCGKSCRLRWINYLRPDLKRGSFSPEEEDLIIHLHSRLGNRWSQIASRMPGRTDNEIKNFWNSTIKKRLKIPNPSEPLPEPGQDRHTMAREALAMTSYQDHDMVTDSFSTTIRSMAPVTTTMVQDTYFPTGLDHHHFPADDGLYFNVQPFLAQAAISSECDMVAMGAEIVDISPLGIISAKHADYEISNNINRNNDIVEVGKIEENYWDFEELVKDVPSLSFLE